MTRRAGVIGVAFGQYILDANPIPTYHQAIGWTVVVLMTAQLTAYAVRPPLVCPGASLGCEVQVVQEMPTRCWGDVQGTGRGT